jgi:hypothetical protein
MPRWATVHAVTAIGIDMGKNTLHMIGLDSRAAIVLRAARRVAGIREVLATRRTTCANARKNQNGSRRRSPAGKGPGI